MVICMAYDDSFNEMVKNGAKWHAEMIAKECESYHNDLLQHRV